MLNENHGRPAGICLPLLLICTAVCLPARAQWGSIRANNRSARELHAPAQAHVNVPRQGRQEDQGARFERQGRVALPEHGGGGERHWGEEGLERRHYDFDEDRQRGYFWSGINPGMAFGALPPGYLPLTVGNTPYFYYGGAYYEQGPSGYIAVNPPIGAIVPGLPPGAEAVSAGPNVEYYAGGAFYQQGPQGFTVVPPPLGVTVSVLPPGATQVYIGGNLYYQYNGVYFLPVMQDGVLVYTTVQPP
jgi:hypothetical protein